MIMKLNGKIAEEGLKAFIQKPEMKNGKKVPRIWVLVADSGVTKIFRKPDGHLELIGQTVPDETMQAELTNKNIGRVTSSSRRGVRQKYEPHMEQAHQDAALFAHDLAKWLDEAVRADAFDRLVLVAAPKTLGDLRAAIHPPVQNRIIAEVDKDLTKLDEKALYDALDEIVWF